MIHFGVFLIVILCYRVMKGVDLNKYSYFSFSFYLVFYLLASPASEPRSNPPVI